MIPSGEFSSPKVRTDIPVPALPYAERKLRTVPNLAEVWSYINPFNRYGQYLGFKRNFEKLLAGRDPKGLEVFHNVEKIKREAATFMKVRAVWEFFEIERAGNTPHPFLRGGNTPVESFRFGRQVKLDGLCVSNYALDPSMAVATA